MQVLRNLMAGLLVHVNTFYHQSQYVCVDPEARGQAFVVWSYAYAAMHLRMISYTRVYRYVAGQL